MHLKSRKKFGFSVSPLHCKKEPHAFHYLSQRMSFWIAALSLIAFVTGNMVGQHGWYAFWKSVLGGVDDSLIVYMGTVAPIEKVPDYEKWAAYGGGLEDHTFRQVPQDVLISLPRYQSSLQKLADRLHGHGNDVYSVGYLGSYETGAEGDGSHPGIDIRTPVGTPVLAIANGIVTKVQDSGGFGKVVVLRHPNVPNPSDPGRTITLYSSYAHLSAIYVSEDTIVHKGEHIADSGDTGYASGPHLHFQIDREEAPWHPYWPFTGTEAEREGMTLAEAVNAGLFQARGYLYTINPMLYVQANYAPVEITVASADDSHVQVISDKPVLVISAAERREQRLARMQARREERMRIRLARLRDAEDSIAQVSEPEEISTPPSVIRSTETVASAIVDTGDDILHSSAGEVSTVHIRHDGGFSGRGWEKITLTIVDASGNPISFPNLNSDLYLRTAYGSAEFRPPVVSTLDFIEGEATVNMLPRGRRTIVIQVHPFNVLSSPMAYERVR